MKVGVAAVVVMLVGGCGESTVVSGWEFHDTDKKYKMIIHVERDVVIEGPDQKRMSGKLLESNLPVGNFQIEISEPRVKCAFTKQPQPLGNYLADCIEVLPVGWKQVGSAAQPPK